MSPLKVAFFVYPSAFQAQGGGEVQLMKTKEGLEKLGVQVKLFDTWTDKVQDFDVFHVFGSVKDCLPMMETAHQKKVKIALSTICWYSWKSAWGTYGSFSAKSMALIRQAAKEFLPFLPSRRKRMMQISDILFPNSQTESKQLQSYFQIPAHKIKVIPNGVDTAFASAKPDAFIEKFGIRDFVLCVGRIEPRKNQLNMVRALKGTSIPFVIVGEPVPQYQSYYELCRKEATANIHFLGGFPHGSELLKSAYAASKVFLLASWLETPGLAALEAALAGASVVITLEGATREYFREHALYADPACPKAIAAQVKRAYGEPRHSKLKALIESEYLWKNVAEQTLLGYQEIQKK